MKTEALRKLVAECQQKGLPVERRAYIKKQLGRQEYDIVAKEYDSFFKSDIIAKQQEGLILYDLGGTLHAGAFVTLRRNLQKVLLFAELKKENILDTLFAAKKLAKILVNKHSYLNEKPSAGVKVVRVPNTSHYRLVSNVKGEDIGAFSISNINSEICNFSIFEKYRKTPEVKEAMSAMNEFFNKPQYQDIVCCVDSDKPFLVRMYEKFGFCMKGILSTNVDGQKHTYFKLQKELPRYDFKIVYE